MKKVLAFLFLIPYLFLSGQERIQENIFKYPDFQSELVTARSIYVRLPADYDQNRNYPVLYMHDGQMLFDTIETWNGQSWGIDKSIREMVSRAEIADLIVIGIANVSNIRHPNYFPHKPFLTLPKELRDSIYHRKRGNGDLFQRSINSDDYLKFIVYELKPFIDSTYSTLSDNSKTFIAGSSMGGLISMYALFEYPEVFGGAACLSTHWIGYFEDNKEVPDCFLEYIKKKKQIVKERKLYFDTGDQTLDQFYPRYQKNVDHLFSNHPQYQNNYLSKYFPGHAHSEDDWNRRLSIPLKFLLQP